MSILKQIMNGDFFRRDEVKAQYPMVVLVAILLFLYILIGFAAGKQQRQLTDIRREVRELKFEYLTISAQLVETTRQSNVASELKRRGSKLEPNITPVTRIK